MEELLEMPLFRNCDAGNAGKFLAAHPGKIHEYAKGDIIAMQGYACRALYLLEEGSVYAKMINEDGKEFTLDTLSAPETLASSFVFSSEGTFPVTIIASTDCTVWTIGRDALFSLIRTDDTILSNYLNIISDHSAFLSRRLHEFALQSLASRIIGYIERNGPIENLQSAAFILGVARPSLSRAIAQLVAQGAIEKSDNGYSLR